VPAGGAGLARTPWHASKAPAGGVREVDEQGTTRGRGRRRRWPAVAKFRALCRRQETQSRTGEQRRQEEERGRDAVED
jgi:hypothetical protein